MSTPPTHVVLGNGGSKVSSPLGANLELLPYPFLVLFSLGSDFLCVFLQRIGSQG